MIEDTTIEDATDKKPVGRRIAVTALLALAALGAHHLHGRTVPRADSEQAIARTVEGDDTTKSLVGPNSLLGDVNADEKISSPVSTDLGVNELDLASLADHAGSGAMTAPWMEGLDSSSLKAFDIGNSTPSEASLSAIPEPTAAGILLLAVVPAASLRRPHNRNRGVKSQTKEV